MQRSTVLSVLIVTSLIVAGCGSNHSGVAAKTARSGASSDEPSSSTSSRVGGYGPITAKQFADTQVCVEAADGGGDAGTVIAGVNVGSERAFDNHNAQVYLFDSRGSAGSAVKRVEQEGMEAMVLRQYGNVVVAYPTSEKVDSQLGHVLPCIVEVYSGQATTVTTQSHPEKFFGDLREWAKAQGYKWLPAFLSAPPGGGSARDFDAAQVAKPLPFLAVARVMIPSTLMHIEIVATAGPADAQRLVNACAKRIYQYSPQSKRYPLCDGATQTRQFAILPIDEAGPTGASLIPAAQVGAVAAGLQHAPPVPAWFVDKARKIEAEQRASAPKLTPQDVVARDLNKCVPRRRPDIETMEDYQSSDTGPPGSSGFLTDTLDAMPHYLVSVEFAAKAGGSEFDIALFDNVQSAASAQPELDRQLKQIQDTAAAVRVGPAIVLAGPSTLAHIAAVSDCIEQAEGDAARASGE